MVASVSLQGLVVLGCRVGPDGTPSPAAQRRLACAAASWREWRVPLLLSGGRRWHGRAEAVAFRDWLTAHGEVPEQALALECRSLTTAENARCSATHLQRRGIGRIGLISCDWHLPRALRAFSRAGLDAVPIPVPSPVVAPSRRLWRALRERGAEPLDAWCTWGWERR